eukprot:scaffold1769_cov164-Ochromonas_danica.AAC.17
MVVIVAVSGKLLLHDCYLKLSWNSLAFTSRLVYSLKRLPRFNHPAGKHDYCLRVVSKHNSVGLFKVGVTFSQVCERFHSVNHLRLSRSFEGRIRSFSPRMKKVKVGDWVCWEQSLQESH